MSNLEDLKLWDEDTFKCRICERCFYCQQDFDVHLELHKKNCDCEICKRPFSNVRSRMRHYYDMHRDVLLKCHSCNIVYHKVLDMNIHKKFHAKECPYLCMLCLKSFETLKLLKDHLTRHESEARKDISQHLTFENDDNELINNGVVKTSCFETGALKSTSKYRAESYICDTCGKTFQLQRTLSRHISIHEKPGTYECDYCSKVFNTRIKLAGHIRNHKDKNGLKPKTVTRSQPGLRLKYPCKKCGKSFSDNRRLKRHHQFHLPKGFYPCHVCERVFDLEVRLKIHLIWHKTDEKIRSKMSKTEGSLFSCEFCGKSFSTNRKLKAHRIIHVESYPCNLCDKTFNKKWNLKTHMAIHLGKKPYACSYCGASYADGSNLKKHLMKHPSELGATAVVIKESLDDTTDPSAALI